jgi:7-keto-8-aminopelargonate synthetase-like enzyme
MDPAWNASQNEMGPHGYPEEFFHDARKFRDGGKANPILLPMLKTSLEQVVQTMTLADGTICFQAAQDRLKQLIEPLLKWATTNGFAQWPGPHVSHIISLRPTSKNHVTPHQLLNMAASLKQEDGIYVSVRCGGFRISPYLDTTPADIESLMDALTRVVGAVPIVSSTSPIE